MKRKLAEMWLLITADRKRTTILGVLLIVLVGVSVQTFMSRGPKKARASSEMSEEAGATTDSRTGAGAELPASEIITVVRAAPVSRDIFQLSDEVFPPPQTEPAAELTTDATKSASGNVETPRAGPTPPVDDVNRRVTQEASRLKLRSVVIGGSVPTVVIEASDERRKARRTVLAQGQTIDGFTLVEIANERATLEKEGVRVVLERDLPEQ